MTDSNPKADAPAPDEGTGASQGGAYPNPHTGKEPGFDGGQTHHEYEGPENANATADE